MKTTSLFASSILFAGLCIATFTSCSSEVDDFVQEKTEVNANELHTCTMNFNAEMPSFEPQAKTRATSSSWKDGDKVYLRFTSPLGITTGTAVYNATKGNWTLNYFGSLYEGNANTCTAVYIENPSSVDGTVISLTERSAIYEDKAGSYVVNEGDLTVTATLTPKVGRIHLSGATGKKMKVFGLSHYTSYDYNTDLYTNTNERFDDEVRSNGYTDYAYVYFTDETNPSLKLWIDGKETYTKFFSSNVLTAGESGVMTLPTEESHNSWAEGLVFNISGALFTMLPVEGGSFTMGATSEQTTWANSNESPTHTVTLDSYCIGETEVTRDVYGKIMNSGYTSTLDYPEGNRSVSTIKSFIEKLNDVTGAFFTLPTEAEWEFAARGGTKATGKVYSGSDDCDEVAWTNANCSAKQPVKQKKPNELGLYDMSGNVGEFCQDLYASYTNVASTNPVNTTGDYFVYRGGSYNHAIKNARVSYRGYASYESYIGFRLRLK